MEGLPFLFQDIEGIFRRFVFLLLLLEAAAPTAFLFNLPHQPPSLPKQ
jgi:hypothetical protein